MNLKFTKLFLLIGVFVMASTSSYGFLPVPYRDDQIFERSDLIVLGHLKKDSIRENSNSVVSAELVIDSVIKGNFKTSQISLFIHENLGLRLVKGTSYNLFKFSNDLGGVSTYLIDNQYPWPSKGLTPVPEDRVMIADVYSHQLVLNEDVFNDMLWFLRKSRDVLDADMSGSAYYVENPEDLQLSELQSYFQAYGSKFPENSVRSYLAENPKIIWRAERWLQQQEIARLYKIQDPSERFQKALPYFLKNRWDTHDVILSCGKVGGEGLIPLFTDRDRRDYRVEIMRIWAEMQYQGAIPLLIETVQQNNKFFASVELHDGWWQDQSSVGNERRDRYLDIINAVRTLAKLNSQAAKEVLQETKFQWKLVKANPNKIPVECDDALKMLSSNLSLQNVK